MKSETYFRTKFEELFRDHFTGMCYFARKYTGDLDSSKEIVHSVFLKIWESRAEFDWNLPAKSYLFTSVYNRSMNYIRDNKKFISHDEAAQHNLVVDETLFSDNLETAELESRIKLALQKLPGRCLEIFELSRFEGKKYAEIAAQLNISVKTVETQMSKALAILKAELKDYLVAAILVFLLNMHHG